MSVRNEKAATGGPWSFLPGRLPAKPLLALLVALFVGAGTVNAVRLVEGFQSSEKLPLGRLWLTSQTDLEYQRLLHQLDRLALDDPAVTPDQVRLRLDILWSRLSTMAQGHSARAMASLPGGSEQLSRLRRDLQALDPALLAFLAGERQDYAALRRQLTALAQPIRELVVNSVQVDNQEYFNGQEQDRRLFNGLLLSLLGLLSSGGLFILLLVLEKRRADGLARAEAEARQALFHQASHDALTGLVNRREFERRLDRVLDSVAERAGEHALCYLDLDQFKVVNDTCGHSAGDELLRQLGRLLSGHIRSRDTLARLGGDEFGLLLEHCPLDQAEAVAGKLLSAINDFRFSWQGRTFRVGASIGLVPVRADSGALEELLSAADTVCYAAKDAGRNRIHVHRPGDAETLRRHGEMQWATRINAALDANRLRLFRQTIRPLQHPGDGEHFELLLRLEDEDGNLIAPGVFLPAAERYNLSPRLDAWVVERALEWLGRHPGQVQRLQLCSINLSGPTLGDERILEQIVEQIRASGVPPEKLCFEVTETAAVADLARAERFIRRLKSLGCSFALDDFGSGMSSFGYLKALPVDYLKIDGLFIRDIAEDPIDLAMVRSINEIGHVLGKRTVAEFVESEAVLDQLRAMGVDYAQGYGVEKPLPLALPAIPAVQGAGR